MTRAKDAREEQHGATGGSPSVGAVIVRQSGRFIRARLRVNRFDGMRKDNARCASGQPVKGLNASLVAVSDMIVEHPPQVTSVVCGKLADAYIIRHKDPFDSECYR